MKRLALTGIISMTIVSALGMAVYAVPAAPPDGGGGNTPGMSVSSASYNGATILSSDTSIENTSYSSSTGAQNALLITGGTIELDEITITKTGDDSGDSSDFYGTNAAIMATGGTVTINDSTIETDGSHANGVFSYGDAKVTVEDTKITTKSNNSGGIMVTGGGTLTAKELQIETAGNSSAAIRSDRGGGTMRVSGGSYKTTGQGSPVIYSTADITVQSASLEATSSEGVVIEGLNSVSLSGVTLEDTNNTLNGNSETYKNIFIYQSMSGDAEDGTGTFTAKNSIIKTHQGDSFFITNTTAVINLINNVFTNTDDSGIFLRAQSGKWGTSGSNGGQVTLTFDDQEVIGDMAIDEISTVDFTLDNASYFKGALNGDNFTLKIADDASVFVLTADTNLQALDNADTDNLNIYANGHKLYVNGSEVSINQGTPPEHKAGYITPDDDIESGIETETSSHLLWWILGGVLVVAVLAALAVVVANMQKSKKHGKIEETYGDNQGEPEKDL